jgi:1-acyl-sn-glycerol-3-phosphate acyltransferase
MARLALSSLGPGLARATCAAGRVFYAAWSWGTMFAFWVPLWLALAAVPGIALRRTLLQFSVRLWLRLVGIHVSAAGLSNIPAERPSVLVPNHASYLDSFVLVAVLPPRFIFLAKKEFDRNVVPSVFLRRLGTLFAERTDAEQGVQDAAATDAVRAGQGLVVFPEGTFHRASGLRPFKLGGFLVAAQAGVPLLPVTIRGMRSILRDGQKVPRPGRASISIGAPIIHRTLQSRPMVCHCKLGIKSTDLLTFHKTPAKPRESHLGEVIGSYWNGQSRANLSLRWSILLLALRLSFRNPRLLLC